MAGWIGPTMAISLLVIALCVVATAAAVGLALLEARKAGKGVAHEVAELRRELGPMIAAINRLGEAGTDVVDLARNEVHELVNVSQEMRVEVRRATRRARRRLADFDALVEVMQGELEETALEAATAMRTLRASRGVVGRVRRFLAPRREDDDE